MSKSEIMRKYSDNGGAMCAHTTLQKATAHYAAIPVGARPRFVQNFLFAQLFHIKLMLFSG